MDKALATFEELAKSKNLLPAEQLLMSACQSVDPFLVSPISDDAAERLFAGLLGLFLANRGEYSLQCAIYIATKLVKLFEISSVPKLWDVINIGEARNSPALVIATGHICRHVGHKFKSQIPHFVQLIMKQDPPMEFAGLHAINCAFKAGGSYVTQLAAPALEFTKKIIQTSSNQAAVWAGLKFLRTLLRASIPPSQVLDVATIAMRHRDQPYLLNEIAYVVARAVFSPYSKLNFEKIMNSGEWTIGGLRNQKKTLNLTPAFQVIETFKSIFASVWTNFLNLIGPELIAMNHAELFEFVRNTSPECVRLLIPMLPADLRFSYFREVAAEMMSAEQLKTLMILAPDDGCIAEAAGVALLLASSDDKQARDVATFFFAGLSKTHSSLVLPYLRSCLVFLVQPPDHNARILIELRGNAAVLCTILENLPDVEAAVVPNFSTFVALITDTCQKPKATSYRFIFTFAVLAVLPERLSRIDGVRAAVGFALQYLGSNDPNKPPKMERRLLKNVMKFCAKYPDPEQNHQLMSVVMTRSRLPFAVINDLCHIIPQTTPDDSLAFPTTKLVLSFALQVKPSQRLIKSSLKRPLPIGTDLISYRKPVSKQQTKMDNFLRRFIESFPGLLNSCNPENQTELVNVLMTTFSVTAILIVTSLCGMQGKLPSNFCDYYLANFSSDASLVQVIAECLARYAENHLIVPQVFEYVKQRNTIDCCILLSALFSRIEVPTQYLSEAVIFLNSMMKNPRLTVIATHALTSLILTHQMRLAPLHISANQFQVLFEILHSSISLQPLVLYVVGECLGALLEAFPSELDSLSTKTLQLLLKTLEVTPISYGKEVYFESARCVYLFAHQLSTLAPISYPKSPHASASLQLTACAAFSDFLKFEKIDFDVKGLLRKLLTLLQRTADARASHFIAALASFMQDEEVSFWIAQIKRILISDSLLESSSFTIEPTPEVKHTCLEIANCIPPMIAFAPVLSTENLDDLISSVCRATETDRLSLQEAAFPPLQKVIELFKDRVTDEGQRLLGLYDSQFSTAVKTGFQVDLAISGGFLSTYLTFNTDNMTVDPENCATILVGYLSGLKDCAQRTTAYFSLATHLCTVTRKYPPLRELIQPFLKTLTPIFSELVLQDMQLYRATSGWRDLSRFRSLASQFYMELVPAFVWLQKISEVVIDVTALVSFLLIQLKSKRESWIKTGAFDALPVLVKNFGDTLSPQILELTIRVGHDYFNENPAVGIGTWMDLLYDTSTSLQSSREFDTLRELTFSLVFRLPKLSHSIMAILLRSDTRKSLSKYSFALFVRLLKHASEQHTVPLVMVMFEHSPSVIGHSLELVLDKRNLPIEFQIDVTSRGLLLSKGNLPLNAISRFVIGSFKKGAMHMVGRIVVEREEIGVALLAEGAAKAAFLLSSVEKGNARAYLRFIQLSIAVLSKNQRLAGGFAKCAIRLAFEIIAKYGGEKFVYAKQILTQCVYTIKDAFQVLGEQESQQFFDTLATKKKKFVVQYVVTSIRAAEQRKKTENLVAFSTHERGHKQGEWQTLDVEGGVASDSD